MLAEYDVFRREWMLVADLVADGRLGEVYSARGECLSNDTDKLETTPWRHTWRGGRNGITYPMHVLGPLLRWFPDDPRGAVTLPARRSVTVVPAPAECPAVSPPFAGRRRVFASICAFSFLVNFGRVGFAPLLDPFMDVFGVGEATAGLIATAAWMGSALPRLPTGLVLTRVRRHRVILGMGAFLVVAAAVTSLATSVLWVGVGALLLGLASGVFFIAANPLVSELFPDHVGLAIGLRGMSSQVAAVGAPGLIGAALFLGSWRLVYRAMALLALLVLAAFWIALRRAELPDAGAADRDLLAAFRAQWRLILAGVALIGAIGFVWQGVFNFYVSYLAAVKGIAPDTGRSLLTLVFVAGLPAFVLTGRIADRVSYIPLLLAILAAFVGSLLALTAAEGVLAIAAVSALMGYVVHSFFPVMDTYMLDSLPDANRASAYAVYSATMMLLQAPGSVALGTMVEAGLGYTAVFRGYGGALAVMLVVLVVLYRVGKLPAGGRPAG